MKRFLMPVVASVLIFSGWGYAHNYVPNDLSHRSAESALQITDLSLSQVVYDPLPNGGQLWLKFEAKAGDPIYLQLGMPYLEHLSDYRPSLALVGPAGTGEDRVPFELPEGLTARRFDSAGKDPKFFDEPFTGTQSWILVEEEFNLAADGTYYIVAFDPEEQGGKLWTAWGKREAFTFRDILNLHNVIRDVRTFHEVQDRRKPFLTWTISTLSSVLDVLFFWVR
ncbi:MAG TPA: hypothetical protein PLO53_01640 [Candidatus Hydrogenedentes bacterium]|nr:hypothetical protein [Candidatus Hydrogenedentota bacterium]HPU96636.1 hypothetical protein [Candidatus Hydrogenedentota bacterium]